MPPSCGDHCCCKSLSLLDSVIRSKLPPNWLHLSLSAADSHSLEAFSSIRPAREVAMVFHSDVRVLCFCFLCLASLLRDTLSFCTFLSVSVDLSVSFTAAERGLLKITCLQSVCNENGFSWANFITDSFICGSSLSAVLLCSLSWLYYLLFKSSLKGCLLFL